MCLKIIIFSISLFIPFNLVSSKHNDEDWIDAVETGIFFGNTAKKGQFPFAGFLTYMMDRGEVQVRELICSGTIIHKNWALTAGHCVIKDDERYSSPLFTVGGVNSDRSDGSTYPIERFCIHNEFEYKLFADQLTGFLQSYRNDNDAALMKFYESIVFDENTKPVHLECDPDKSYVGEECTFLGWGFADVPEKDAPFLLYLHSNVIDTETCRKLSNYEWDITNKLHTCVSLGNGKKTGSTGDSGGPLIANGRVIGIHTIGLCAGPNPSVFGTTCSIFEWIRQHMIECGDDDLYDFYAGERHNLYKEFERNDDRCNHPEIYHY